MAALTGTEQAQLEAYFYRLTLGLPEEGGDYAHAVKRVVELLKADVDAKEGETTALRLRLAMHLAPPTAIAYESTIRESRHRLVRRYLEVHLGFPAESSDMLSRAVAQVLSDWQERRSAVTAWRQRLLKSQAGLCAHCRFAFGPPLTDAQAADVYKPYAVDVDLYCAPEVDHIDAVSALGSNAEMNLQVLCALCNRGKGQGFGLSVAEEYRHAATPISKIAPGARATMLFYVIARAANRCEVCVDSNAELTVRRTRATGPYVRSNLRAVCRSCA